MDIIKSDSQVTGNAGLYFCCYELSKRGWNVMPTARNARGVDLIAYDRSAQKIIGVQVKTLSKRSAVPLGTDLNKIMGHYWVIVNHVYTDHPRAFIMRPSDVRQYAKKTVKDGKVNYWLDAPKYDTDDFFNRWDIIGDGHGDELTFSKAAV